MSIKNTKTQKILLGISHVNCTFWMRQINIGTWYIHTVELGFNSQITNGQLFM